MDDYSQDKITGKNKSIKGYQTIIVIMAVILVALSLLYFRQVNNLKADFAVERDTLTNRFTALMGEYDNIKTSNDTISFQLSVQRGKADSLLQRLQRERSFSASKVKAYEKELGTLRTVMRGFVHQIDSLNTLNKKLITENIDIRRQISTVQQRADAAEERAGEMEVKIRKGSVIRARDISLVALSGSDREVTRASRAARLRVDFTLAANELAIPGQRNVYAQIKDQNDYLIANSGNSMFDFEGDRLVYSATREVDYQNLDLSVSLYYSGSGITAGKYKVLLYMDGYQIGSNEVILR